MECGIISIQFPGYRPLKRKVIPDSSMVEHTAVNRGVVGSSPTRGVGYNNMYIILTHIIMEIEYYINIFIWLHGQEVKTSPFHGGNTGSNPVGVIFIFGDLAKW